MHKRLSKFRENLRSRRRQKPWVGGPRSPQLTPALQAKRPGEIYPTNNVQLLKLYHAIAALDQENNTRFLISRCPLEASHHVITRSSCVSTNGIPIAIDLISQWVEAHKHLTANNSPNAAQAMYKKELARQIVAYLRDHPFSGDTLEGVSRWWLKQQSLSECVSDVHQALVGLGNEGLIHERTMPDGRTLFFANIHAEEEDDDAVDIINAVEEGQIQ